MSFFDDLFGGGSQEIKLPWDKLQGQQIKSAEDYGKWLRNFFGQYTPGEAYTGNLTTKPSSQETAGLSILDKFLGAPETGVLYGAGRDQILNTLGGKFADPSTSPFIQAMMKMNQRGTQEAIDQSRLGQGARGKFYSTQGLREEGNIRSKSQEFLDSIVGQFIQNERQNMLRAVPQAMAFEQYPKEAALQKISASQRYGSLQRLLDQANMENMYNQWARQRGELSGTMDKLGGFAFQGLPYQTTKANVQKEASPWAGVLGSVLGNMVLPGVGGMLGGMASKLFSGVTGNTPGISSMINAIPGLDAASGTTLQSGFNALWPF